MTIYSWLVLVSWFSIILYWILSGLKAKKVIQPEKNSQGLWLPITFIILFFLQLYVFKFEFIPHTIALGAAGATLCVLGVMFAIWARAYLGRNWNARPSIQEEHKLITSGPYHFVRHPTYTGIMVAIAGSVLVDGTVWLIIFTLFGAELIRRIGVEEKLMTKLFPDTYPDYRKRTKALIPFIW